MFTIYLQHASGEWGRRHCVRSITRDAQRPAIRTSLYPCQPDDLAAYATASAYIDALAAILDEVAEARPDLIGYRIEAPGLSHAASFGECINAA